MFFDGVCGLCNKAVDWLIRWDKRHVLKFAPLQGATAAAKLGPLPVSDPDSLVFLVNGRIYTRSEGFLMILKHLGGFWKFFLLFWIIPPFLRNGMYKLVAANRYRWFGKQESCRLPSLAERDLFLP